MRKIRQIVSLGLAVVVIGATVAGAGLRASANTGNFDIEEVKERVEFNQSKLEKIITEEALQGVQLIKAIHIIDEDESRMSKTYKEILTGQLSNVLQSMKDYRSISDGLGEMQKQYEKYIGNRASVTASEIINFNKDIDLEIDNNDYIMPVECLYVSSLFKDSRPEAIGHTGIDFAARKNTDIKVVDDGIVIFAGDCGTYGTAVFVLHGNNKITVYAHMIENSNTVEAGDYVSQGDVVGKVGMTGRATGYHLHFEVIEDGERQDPINYFDYNFEEMER